MINIQPNYMQDKIADMGANHILRGSRGAFEFSGRAGTGKSVVMKLIQERSGLILEEIAPMSYIGQAAIIMRLKGFPNARTEHSWLFNYERGQLKDASGVNIINSYFGIEQDGLIFTPKPMYGKKAIIIDEAGTTPIEMKDTIESHNIPIIAAGDLRQLPPVKSKPAYLYGNNVPELTEVMRQKSGSGILFLADRALNGYPIHHGLYGNDAMVIYEDELTDDLLASADMVLCGTNATRENVNKHIREDILGYHGTTPHFGEKVICRKNDWMIECSGIGLGNGLIGRVVNEPEVSDFDGSVFYIDFAPDLFNGVFSRIDVDYEYFIAPFNIKNELKQNRYSVGHKFDYAYCITVHLSQGAQYPNVIYFEDCNMPSIQNNLNYTAITRAYQNLIYVKRRPKIWAIR